MMRRAPMRSRPAMAAMLAVAALAAACDDAAPSGPPHIRLGRDECAACKMSVVDERCAAGALVEDAEGVRHLVFDDIRCLLLYARGHEDAVFRGRWVQDYRRSGWLDASGARFLLGSRVRTAMGSGIIAVAPTGDAAADEAEFGGKASDWTALQSWRMTDATDPASH